jgi:hypothetical protein
MIVIGGDDRLPETAAVLIARWAWRYRSELAPVYLAVLTMLAGWALHATYPAWWWAILSATVVGTAGVAACVRRLGLPTLAERLYAAAIVLADAGWLAAAVAA